jgi:chromosome segregation ATPase
MDPVQYICGYHFLLPDSFAKGKSAIIVALQICLGARANKTGRGNQTGKYVREGTPANGYALIQVTLRNEGSDAYEKEKYGRRIMVETKINPDGGSRGYSIKDINGKVSFLLSLTPSLPPSLPLSLQYSS